LDGDRDGDWDRDRDRAKEILGVFRWQNFWRKISVALSLLFGKICPTMD
jgi:hypothetical protein